MASEQAVLDLKTIIEDCLTSKIKAGYDANSALTIDIARQVATEVEARATEYTDEEIAKIKALIGGDEDLQPLIDLLNVIKNLLDGDGDTSNGFDTFNKLISDTLANKNTLVNHTTSLSLIQQQLADISTSIGKITSDITDHDDRLKALEGKVHEPVDCEDCHDGILAVVGDAMDAACKAAGTAIANYTSAANATTSRSFADELDPIKATGAANVDVNGIIIVEASKVTGRRMKSLSFTVQGSVTPPQVIALDANGSVTSKLNATSTNPGNSVVMTMLDSNGVQIGASMILLTTYEDPLPPIIIDDPLPEDEDRPLIPPEPDSNDEFPA